MCWEFKSTKPLETNQTRKNQVVTGMKTKQFMVAWAAVLQGNISSKYFQSSTTKSNFIDLDYHFDVAIQIEVVSEDEVYKVYSDWLGSWRSTPSTQRPKKDAAKRKKGLCRSISIRESFCLFVWRFDACQNFTESTVDTFSQKLT